MNNITTTIKLSGLTCSACQKVTQKRISQIEGVHDVQVNLEASTAVITADRAIQSDEVIKALEGTHYHVIA